MVDPDMAIVGDVRVKAPADMSRAALAHAPTARGRWLAADALSETDDPVTIAALVASLVDDGEFWGVRVEAAEALGRIHAKECEVALRAATSIAHPKVRRAVVVALGRFRTASAEGALLPVALEDDSYLVEADAARSLGKTRRDGTLSTLVDLLDRDSWADVVRIGAIDGLAALRDDRAMPHLVARTRYGHSERVRRAAMMALTRISTDRKTRELIEDLLDDAHPYVRMDAVRALGEIGDAKSRGPLRARLPVELDARVRRRIREVVRDLGGESKHAVASLREEFEKLTTEARELRSRIAKLEARTSKDAEGGEAPKTSSKPPAKATRAKNVPRRAPAKRRSTPKKR
ncbi:MAG: HEAT repeat domain-containing protein [Polyangiaceae bacterium]